MDELTHVVPCSAEIIEREWRTYRALCGALVPAERLAIDGDPTCLTCKRIDDEEMKALEALKAD